MQVWVGWLQDLPAHREGPGCTRGLSAGGYTVIGAGESSGSWGSALRRAEQAMSLGVHLLLGPMSFWRMFWDQLGRAELQIWGVNVLKAKTCAVFWANRISQPKRPLS